MIIIIKMLFACNILFHKKRKNTYEHKILWWIQWLFFIGLEQLFIFSTDLQSKENWGLLTQLRTLIKIDACFYIPQLWWFFMLIFTGPLGTYTAHISAHLWDEHLQRSKAESPTHSKLFIQPSSPWPDVACKVCAARIESACFLGAGIKKKKSGSIHS